MSQYPSEDRGATAFDSSAEGIESGSAPGGEPVWPPRQGDAAATSQSSTKETAQQEAGAVKDTAVGAGKDVADTAKGQAQNVVGETKAQAKGLLDQVKTQANDQAGTQQQRLAGIVGSYSGELDAMASGSDESGPLTDLVRQGADKGQEFSRWLEHHEPSDLLREVQSFARRRPGVFLIGAAVAGIAVGRLTRGFAAEAKDEKQAGSDMQSLPTQPASPRRPGAPQIPAHADPYDTRTDASDQHNGLDVRPGDPDIENTLQYGSVRSGGNLGTEDTTR